MDSISQIVLGASMGEAVLGKKLGNKAMLWGAIGGTIPDLDIIFSPFLSEIDALTFHRGYSHSLLFAVLGALLFGWMAHRLHASKYYGNVLRGVLSLLISSIPVSIIYFLFSEDAYKYYFTALALMISGAVYYSLSRNENRPNSMNVDNPSMRRWQVMFFLALSTHAILDCFTVYGTQIFLPFSEYRVAIASIAVADPLGYTIPFIICLLVAMRFGRSDKRRAFWNLAGIGVSSLYLCFTVWNKQRVFQKFDQALQEQNIQYDRYTLNPMIFSNFLWNITVENEERFYNAAYSVFDTSPIEFIPIEKNHDLISDGENDKTLNTLKWFSNDFYNVMEREDGLVQLNDLRYGTFRQEGHIDDFIFRYRLDREAHGKYKMIATIGGPDEESTTDLFGDLFERIGGK